MFQEQVFVIRKKRFKQLFNRELQIKSTLADLTIY